MTVRMSSDRSPVSGGADSGLWADLMLLAPVMKVGRDELVEAMTERFLGAVVLYPHTLPERGEVLVTYAGHLDAVLEAAELPMGEQVGVVRAVAVAQGRAGAAEAVPLAVLVEFYRLGLLVLSALLLEGAEGTPKEVLADGISAVGRLQDLWVQSMTAAYLRESREEVRWREQRRSALVGRLLDGRVQDAAELWDVAEALRLPHDSRYVVVALEIPGTSPEKVRAVESRLNRAGIPSAWRSLTDGQTVVLGIVVVGGSARRPVLTEVLSHSWESRVGISPQFDTLDSAQRAARFARLAMAGAPRGSSSVTAFEEAPVAVVAASTPDVLAEVSRSVLGTLNQLPDEDREVLVGTLRTWLARGGSTEATAKALFCHPNTVRYRLNRITEHTGRSLTDPLAVTELALALQGDLLARCA